MFIKTIKFAKYRNIDSLKIDLSSGVNVFTGDNAQGKTNIIEGIWLFASCKSFRTNNDKDLIMNDERECKVTGKFECSGRDYNAEIMIPRTGRRNIRLNGINVRPKEILGKFTAVLFFPEHLSLIKDGPEQRRKFLDFSICQIKPRFYDILSEYSKVISQRNFVLKDQTPDLDLLDVYDVKAAHLSCLISKTRVTYLKKLEEQAKKIMLEISSGTENLDLAYETNAGSFNENELLALLRDGRQNDLRLGYTGIGAHKDDMLVMINGMQAKSFASQGQQRSCVMSMKIAEAEMLYDFYGEYPLMLFDDVFSELDASRKDYITNKIKDKQVIITTCDDNFDFENAKVFRVKKGNAEAVKCL